MDTQRSRQRANLIQQANTILAGTNRQTGISREAEVRFEEIMGEIDSLDREAHMMELTPQGKRLRAGMATIHNGRPSEEVDPTEKAFYAYLKNGMDGLDHEDRAIALRHFQQPNPQASQGVGTGAGGGFAVPDAPMGELVGAMKQIGGLLAFATIIPSETGAPLPIPTTDERSQKGEIVNENSQHNEQDITLASVVLDSFNYSSKIVRVSTQLMDDAAFPFGPFVMKLLGERIGRATAEHFVTGDGASKPRGITVACPVGKTAASPTAITYDELVDVLHSVDPFYRLNGTWLMNDVTFALLRKLKDGQSRPLYGELANAEPNMLMGHKVSIDNNMPNPTTGLKPIVFGDLKSYYVRIVKSNRVLRLQERFAEFGQLGFLGFLRCDADLVDGGGGAVKSLQMA